MGGHGKSRKNPKKGHRGEAKEAGNGDCDCGPSGSYPRYRSRTQSNIQGAVSNGSVQKKLLGGGAPFPPPSARREICVTELDVNVHHENRILSGTFCVEPFVIDCVHTVLEDKFGNTVRVLINDDAFISSTRKPKALTRYAKGKNVQIFEPFYKMCKDGGTVISVEDHRDIIGDPGEVVEGEKQPPILNGHASEPSPLSAQAGMLSSAVKVDDVRSKGNRLFAAQDWKGALNSYSECITTCLQLRKASHEVRSSTATTTTSTTAQVSDDENLCNTLMLAYSNRSETWLRLRSFDEAQSDACKALELDPKHVKSLVRNGKALHELQLFEDALACFNAALRESPDDSTLKLALAKCRTSHEQSRDGVYDLSDYYLSCCSRQPPPCSEFVGCVEIRQPAGRMRGLFATKDIAAGELLLVSNAIAFCYNDKHRSYSEDEGCGSCEACEKQKSSSQKDNGGRRNPHCVDELVEQLMAFTRSSKRRTYQVASLTGACLEPSKELPGPCMDLFRPGSKWIPSVKVPDLDSKTLQNVVRVNSIDDILNDPRYFMCGETEQLVAAVWLLPSFMNHSCCANAETWLIGEAMFVRACRPISAGEELTRSYFDTLKGLERRQEIAKQWLFKCNCPRCEWEGSLSEQQNKVRKKLCSRVRKLFTEAYSSPYAPNLESLANSVQLAEESPLFAGLEGKYRLWMRASLMDAYIANIHGNHREGLVTVSRVEAIKTVLEVMVEVGGGLALRPQIASTLLRDVKKKFGKNSAVFRSTESYVVELYRPFYGDVNKKVFWTLVKMHAGGNCLD